MVAPKGHPRWGGRQKGVPNKRTLQVAQQVTERLQGGLLPIDVMFDNMMYAHTESQKAAKRFAELLSSVALDADDLDNEVERMRVQVEHMRTTMDQWIRTQAYRDRSQKYAADLAQYVHPKLSAVAVRNVDPEQVRTTLAIEFADWSPAMAPGLPAPTAEPMPMVRAPEKEPAE